MGTTNSAATFPTNLPQPGQPLRRTPPLGPFSSPSPFQCVETPKAREGVSVLQHTAAWTDRQEVCLEGREEEGHFTPQHFQGSSQYCSNLRLGPLGAITQWPLTQSDADRPGAGAGLLSRAMHRWGEGCALACASPGDTVPVSQREGSDGSGAASPCVSVWTAQNKGTFTYRSGAQVPQNPAKAPTHSHLKAGASSVDAS